MTLHTYARNKLDQPEFCYAQTVFYPLFMVNAFNFQYYTYRDNIWGLDGWGTSFFFRISSYWDHPRLFCMNKGV